MTNEIKNIPQLRFPNFDGDWEECKLEEISDKVTEKNSGGNILYTGHYNDYYPNEEYKVVDGTLYYKSNKATIESVEIYGKKYDSKPSDIRVTGGVDLQTFLTITGFKRVKDRYSFTYSVCTTHQNGTEFEKKENIKSYNLNDPFLFEFTYNTPSLINGTTSKILYINFLVKDKNSDALIQGFYKFTLVL